MKRKDEILDTFFHGRILVLQKRKGYRFSIDAPLLADFIQTRESDKLLELGTGSGIISLLLSIKLFKHLTALEIQEHLADLARRNVELNRLEKRITIIQEDFRLFNPGKKFDIVFSNPPYIKKRGGHLSACEEKAIAKHEIKSDIYVTMEKTSELLKKEGKAYFIFPEKRKDDFILAVKHSGLKIRAVRSVYSRQESIPSLFLTECGFITLEEIHPPPLILYDAQGKYTAEAEEIFAGRIHALSPGINEKIGPKKGEGKKKSMRKCCI